MIAPTPRQATGVILAGGKGRRMGGMDKGLVQLAGRPLIEHVIDGLAPQVGGILINANRNHDAYRRYRLPVIGDDLTDYQGPLAGFAVAMRAAPSPWILTVPCDGPSIPGDLFRRMGRAMERDGAELAVAHAGKRLQPVYALLPVDLADSLDAFLAEGERKIDLWYARHRVAVTDFSDCPGAFLNINTRQQHTDLERHGTAPDAPAGDP